MPSIVSVCLSLCNLVSALICLSLSWSFTIRLSLLASSYLSLWQSASFPLRVPQFSLSNTKEIRTEFSFFHESYTFDDFLIDLSGRRSHSGKQKSLAGHQARQQLKKGLGDVVKTILFASGKNGPGAKDFLLLHDHPWGWYHPQVEKIMIC